MINSIIEAISVSLNGEFGDDYEIHMEEIKQRSKVLKVLGHVRSNVFGMVT